ncbi:MAG: hypothetical protein QOJ02_218, partial [Acidobacteriota bacterium]|nr:hypothetical protein [Acidobacteriota bacterium]
APDLYQDSIFGKAGKYFVAWERLVQRALEDSAFYSIAHVLESEDDLKCSIHLASNYYYKQASQTLRSFLEDLILPIHFCEVPQDYTKWIANNYRVPSMRTRKKDGMLDTLTQRNVLSSTLADEAGRLYGELNSFVHGSEARLINKGLYTNQGQGHVFKIDDLYEWCKYFSQTVDAGIQLLKISLDQWDGFRKIRRLICTYCHNDKNFDSKKYTFGGEEFTKYTCRNCAHEMTFDANWAQWYAVSLHNKLTGEVQVISHVSQPKDPLPITDDKPPAHESIPKEEDMSFDMSIYKNADLTDVESVDAIIHAFYEGMSFKPGELPNWKRLQTLFLPGARLIDPTDGSGTNIYSFQNFGLQIKELIESTGIKLRGSKQSEISHKIETFENIAQVWSVYEMRDVSDDSLFLRGTQSVQLVRGSGRWWIVNLLWDLEREEEVAVSEGNDNAPLSD